MKNRSGVVVPAELGNILQKHLDEHIAMLEQHERQREFLADARRQAEENDMAEQQLAAQQAAQAEQEETERTAKRLLEEQAARDAAERNQPADEPKAEDPTAVKTEEKVDYDPATDSGAASAVTPTASATSAPQTSFYGASATPKRQRTASATPLTPPAPPITEDDAMGTEEELPPIETVPAAASPEDPE